MSVVPAGQAEADRQWNAARHYNSLEKDLALTGTLKDLNIIKALISELGIRD